MIKLKHYSTQMEFKDFIPLLSDFGESNTDTTTWRPDISQVRAIAGSVGSSNKTLLYDFPDGKDNGETVQTFIRSKSLDVTEIDKAQQFALSKINDKVSDEVKSSEEKKLKKKVSDVLDKALSEKEQDSPKNGQESSN